MFTSFVSFAQTLERAGKPKFSGGMKRIQFQSVLEGGNCFLVLPQLRLRQADKVKDIRIVGGEPGGGFESSEGLLRICLVLVHQSERVPGMCVAGMPLKQCV